MAAGTEVWIDIRKGARENSAEYFDRAKKLKEKLRRIRALLESESKPAAAKRPAAEKAKKKTEWYERFRHFISSEGNLVIGGKDARMNEEVIKKHTSKADTVFHADPAGSPFVVIRGACGEKTLSEAATFCAAHSRAWQARIASVDVYCVKPEQVSKKALPGEFLPKGAFMIYGEKRYFKNTVLELAVFVSEDGLPAAAPPSAANQKKSVVIIPGGIERKETIREIKAVIGFPGRDDEIDKLLPPGKCEFLKRRVPDK
ncbi:MAG: NFACT RNA binding domain-containing protein [archaeon]